MAVPEIVHLKVWVRFFGLFYGFACLEAQGTDTPLLDTCVQTKIK